jgi:lipopolysaccharide exporter
MTATFSASISRIRSDNQQPPRSLAANVRSGAIWNISSTIILRLGSIGATAIVARILSPHDFGVFAVATTVFTIVSAFGEFGVTSCLARADLDADALAPTLWSVSFGSSLIMAGVLYVFARPIAASLGSTDGAGPVRVMAIIMVLWGVAAVPTALCVREFKQGKIFLANVLAFIPSTVVLIFLAKHGSGAMAFAWSRVVAQVISCTVILFAIPKLHRPGMTRGALRILYRFGLPLAFANFVGYILQNVDYVLIGRLMGPVMLGTYVLAFNAASWSTTLLMGVLSTVSMPAFSRVKHDAARLTHAMANSVRAVMLIAAPMCALVMVLARPIVLTLYGGRWAAAATVLSILSIYGLISIVGVLFSNMLAAIGRPKSVLVIQLIWLAALVPAMTLGVHRDGIVGAGIAHIVIVGPIVLPAYLIALKRATDVRASDLAKAASPPLAAAIVAAGLAWLAASQFNRPILELTVGMTVGGLCYIVLTAPQLILLLGRGRAAHPRVKRFLRVYNNIGRALGIPVGSPPRHAMRGRVGHRRYVSSQTGKVRPCSTQLGS